MKKFWQLVSRKDLYFGLAIFALVLVFSFVESANKVKVEFGEQAVDVIAAKYSMNIPYDLVDHIELVEMPDRGDIQEGRDDMSIRFGTWVNEAWGEYQICADLGASNAIVVHLTDGRIFVFSRLNNEETAEIFNTFQTCLEP